MGSNAQLRSVVISPIEEPKTDVKLTLPARPENVAVIRHILGAFAETLRLPDDLVEDLRLAVTEACTNVIRHAYPNGSRGPVEIEIRPYEAWVSLVVTDRGRGLGASADHAGPGLGLPLIAAMAESVELQPGPGGGSRLEMTFARRGRGAPR